MTGSQRLAAAHNLIALHLSLEVPPVELEVTGKVQEIFCLRQFLGSWWDEMLLYLLLRPPLSADLEIMTPSTTSPLCSSPPPLLLCSFAHWFLCFWGNKGELSITISSCSGHVQAHRQIPLQLWRFWTLFNVQFFHICQVWLLFELPLSFIGSLDEFVALKVNFGVLCGERNILNYFI